VKGTVELFEVQDGIWTKQCEFNNNILYSGYDAMAKAFAGDSDFVVNGMYIEYMNGTPTQPIISLDRSADYYEQLDDPYGYVRIKTISQPVFSPSDASKYESNVITLIGVTDGTSAGGAEILDGTSQFYSLALVSIPSLSNKTTDTLVSAAPIMSGSTFTPKTKLANSQLGFKWSLKLGD
jgi:hypothetical protein